MTTQYYRYNATTRVLTAEPRYIVTIDGTTIVNPSAEQYATLRDAYPKGADAPQPTPLEGKVVAYGGYSLGDDKLWHKQWVLVDAPPRPPRRWSRLTIKGALADARLLPAARTFLSAYEIKPDYPALEAFSDCDYIEEFYGGVEKWNSLLDSAAQALGMTRVEVDAFLDSLPEEAS